MEDLSRETLSPLLGERPFRTYPALNSTEADAMSWARADDGPDGAVVVADYQASPRGRGGLPWKVWPGHGLAFSLLVRPELPTEREGWLYLTAVSGLADVLGRMEDVTIRWPEEVHAADRRLGAVGVHVELGPGAILWAVIGILAEDAEPPRGPLLREIVTAIEHRCRQEPDQVIDDLRPRCATLGRDVVARLVPLGPAGPEIEGRATDLRADGSLAIETGPGRRIAVPPQNLGLLEAG